MYIFSRGSFIAIWACHRRHFAKSASAKVETNEPGGSGWDEASLEWKTRGVVGAVEDFPPMLITRVLGGGVRADDFEGRIVEWIQFLRQSSGVTKQ